MKMLKIFCIVVSGAGLLAAPASFAEETLQWGYHGDVSLVYYDKFKNPFSKNESWASFLNDTSKGQTNFQPSGVRALGLGRFKLNIEGTAPGQTRFRVGLRPDALNQDIAAQEFDGRAGEVYAQRPKITFLDHYELAMLFVPNLELGFGVYEDIAYPIESFRPLLEFGLEVQLVQRFAGAGLRWRATPATTDYAQASMSSGFASEIVVFQGNEDRVEKRRYQDETQDRGPESEDAHLGLAGVLSYTMKGGHILGLLIGSGKSDYLEEVSSNENATKERRGKKEELFLQLFNLWQLAPAPLPTRISLDLRLLKETWKGEEIDFDPRLHQSIFLGANIGLLESISALFGIHYGTSQMQNDVTVSGYQLDFGGAFTVKPGLSLNAFLAEEHRDKENSGESIGGFTIDGRESAVLRRFALELNYLFGKN